MVCQPNLLKFSGETVKLQKRLINSDVIFLEATLNVNRTIYHMSVHVVFGTWIWCSSRERWICILHLAFTSKKTIERAIWDTAKVKAIWDNPYIKTTSTVSLMFCHHVWTWGANHMRSPSLSRPRHFSCQRLLWIYTGHIWLGKGPRPQVINCATPINLQPWSNQWLQMSSGNRTSSSETRSCWLVNRNLNHLGW